MPALGPPLEVDIVITVISQFNLNILLQFTAKQHFIRKYGLKIFILKYQNNNNKNNKIKPGKWMLFCRTVGRSHEGHYKVWC